MKKIHWMINLPKNVLLLLCWGSGRIFWSFRERERRNNTRSKDVAPEATAWHTPCLRWSFIFIFIYIFWGEGDRKEKNGGVSEFLSFQDSEVPSFQVSKFPRREGGREGGGTNERVGNLSCDLRANKRPKKMHPMVQTDKQTDRQKDIATLSENINLCNIIVTCW